MLDADFYARYCAIPSVRWQKGVARLWSAWEGVTGANVVFEGFEPPARPVLYATNSTQKNDFMGIRGEWWRRGVSVSTVTKAKNYHHRLTAYVLGKTGVIPLASRGYFLVLDFMQTVGRRPDEEEYRSLRSHLVEGTPLPPGGPFEALQYKPRDILGRRFDPTRESWRDALRALYVASMGETVRLSRSVVERGLSVQMYPEGTVSSRLGKGRIGAVQLALALGVPIVPAGMSGCREVFRGQGFGLRRGTITVRFGAPMELPRGELPDDFRPFHPDDEARHRATLERWTEALMTRIDGLLDERYRRQEGFVSDGTKGTRRFL